MKSLLYVPLLLLLACRENPSPESHALVTASEPPPTASATTTTTETNAPAQPPVGIPAVTGPKLLPVDEAPADPSLVAYREELLAAVRRRDVDAVVALSDPNVRTSFGDDGGAEELRRKLQDGALMNDLEQILPLGGKFTGPENQRTFWAPYVYSAWPDRHDAFQSLAVIGENVPLRDEPDANARVLAMLSHDIVGHEKREGDWFRIKTADGRTGWVEKSSVVSPVGYRAGLSKVDGQWRMRALVAGD